MELLDAVSMQNPPPQERPVNVSPRSALSSRADFVTNVNVADRGNYVDALPCAASRRGDKPARRYLAPYICRSSLAAVESSHRFWLLADRVVSHLPQAFGQALIAARILRVIRFCRSLFFVIKLQGVVSGTRKSMSESKRRFENFEYAFDLDLTYITDKLIVGSVPAEGLMQAFRNPLSEVVRFFKVFHPGHFRIYNACPEEPYSGHAYDPYLDRMQIIYIPYRLPPLMHQIIEFLLDAREYIEEDPQNVIAVQSRNGTGRSGCLACAWLLYTKASSSAREALTLFGRTRTEIRVAHKLQGVETASQKRYVQCIDQLLNTFNCYDYTPMDDLKIPPACPLRLRTMRVDNLFNKSNSVKHKTFIVVIYQGRINSQNEAVWEKVGSTVDVDFMKGECEFNLQKTIVRGDVRIAMFDRQARFAAHYDCDTPVGNEPGLVLSFCFHTAFVNFDTQQLVITNNHMDLPPDNTMQSTGCFSVIPYNPNGTCTLNYQGKNPWVDENGEFFGISEASKQAARQRKIERMKSTVMTTTMEDEEYESPVDAYNETKSKLVNFISKTEEKFQMERVQSQVSGDQPVELAQAVSVLSVGTEGAGTGDIEVITAGAAEELPNPLSPPFTKGRVNGLVKGEERACGLPARGGCGFES